MFEDRAALIFGATHRVARYVVRGLTQKGAFVVAVDHDEAQLIELARTNPSQIEPLAYGAQPVERCAALRQAWSEEPLDLLIVAPEEQSTGSMHRQMVSRAFEQFGPRLMASGGRALCLFDGFAEGSAMASVEHEANALLMRELSKRDHLAINGISVAPGAAPGIAAARSLAMLSPLMSGITGALMTFGALSDAAL